MGDWERRKSILAVRIVKESGRRVLWLFLHKNRLHNQPRGIHEFLCRPHLKASLVYLKSEVGSTFAKFNSIEILKLPFEADSVSWAPIEPSRDIVWEYLLRNMSFPTRMDFWMMKQIAKECIILPLGYSHPIFHMLRNMVTPFIPREKQAMAGLATTSKCAPDRYPHLGVVGMPAGFPAVVHFPMMLTKIACRIEDLMAVVLGTLPCLLTRLMEIVHMFLPI
jgi:hypothetical protein